MLIAHAIVLILLSFKIVIVIATLLIVSVASYKKAPINFESTDNSATAYSESNFYTSVYSETVR